MKKILQFLVCMATVSASAQFVISNESSSGVSNNSASINYSVNTNGGTANRLVTYKLATAMTSFTSSASAAVTTTSATPFSTALTSLTQNRRYLYTVVLEGTGSNVGTNAFGPNRYFTTTGTAAVPIISAVSVGSVTNNSAVLTYTMNPNHTSSANAQILFPNHPNIGFTGPNASGTTPASYNTPMTGLAPNTTYAYEIYGTNAQGESVPITGTFTTLASATPIYHYRFSGNLNEANGGPAFVISPLTQLPFSFPNNTELLIPQDNLQRTPVFRATLPLLPQANAARTVSIRINYESGALASENNVFSYGAQASTQAYGFTQNQTANGVNYFWGSTDLSFPNSTSFATWYTLTFVYDGTTATIYRNGAQVQQAARTLNTNGTVFRLGSIPDETVRYLNARIDDLQIYNVALTASQVSTLHSALSAESFSNNNLKFSLYPNPAHSILNIDLANDLQSVEIYSLQGQKVLSATSKQVNVANLSSGMYMVRVQDVDGGVATQKFVKE